MFRAPDPTTFANLTTGSLYFGSLRLKYDVRLTTRTASVATPEAARSAKGVPPTYSVCSCSPSLEPRISVKSLVVSVVLSAVSLGYTAVALGYMDDTVLGVSGCGDVLRLAAGESDF